MSLRVPELCLEDPKDEFDSRDLHDATLVVLQFSSVLRLVGKHPFEKRTGLPPQAPR